MQVASCVDEFLKSDSEQLAFDPTLSAQGRFWVHEVRNIWTDSYTN